MMLGSGGGASMTTASSGGGGQGQSSDHHGGRGPGSKRCSFASQSSRDGQPGALQIELLQEQARKV